MPKLRVALDELTTAMESQDSEWLLDTRTGDVLIAEWLEDPDLRGEFLGEANLDDGEIGRFRGVETVPSSRGFRWMETFAARQAGEVRNRLLDALDGSRPFRRFKDALFDFPEVRDAWFAYHQERMDEEALHWLRSLGMEIEVVRRGPDGAQTVEPLPPASASDGDGDGDGGWE